MAGTNHGVTFGGRGTIDVPAGASVWSDPVDLAFVHDANTPVLDGRKLAVSFTIVGESGPMTWHAKALQTSYVSRPGEGDPADAGEAACPISTTSWYFLDALDMMAPATGYAVVAFGDSITDGTLSTLNGDDRWPDVLARRLRARPGPPVSVVNAGIGGNRVVEQLRKTASLGPGAKRGQRVVRWIPGKRRFVIEAADDLGT